MISSIFVAFALGQAHSPAPTATPVVPQAVIVVPQRPPLIFFSGATSKNPPQWILISPKGTPTKSLGDAFVIVDPVPGQVYKVAQVALGDTPPQSFDFAEVTAPGVAPIPVPVPPVPVPDVTPAPVPVVTGHISITMFYDINDPGITPFRIDSGLRKSLKELDCDWYLLATSSPAAAPFLPEIAFVGTPVIVIQDDKDRLVKSKDGKVLTFRDVKSPAELLHQIKALKGK